jgi:hypothetical protein
MGLGEDLERVAGAARALASPDGELAAVIPTEPAEGLRVYLCAFGNGADSLAWLALDEGCAPIDDRRLLRDAVSIAALCEAAEESAGGGKLDELRAQLAELRETEHLEGIEEAEAAAAELAATLGQVPRLATPAYLDEVGTATRRLELALGESARSPFADAMKQALATTVEELKLDVETRYKMPLG